MGISIWYRQEGKKPEVIDKASTERGADYLAYEYSLAFGTLYGQHRHGKDKVWAGRKSDEPDLDPEEKRGNHGF